MEKLVDTLIAQLKARFAHFKDLSREHVKDGALHYVRGNKTVPNPHYEQQLKWYHEEKARREDEDRDGQIRKRPLLSKPSTTMTAWDADGVDLYMRFTEVDPNEPMVVRAATCFLMPGYEDIQLGSFGREYVARWKNVEVNFRIDGGKDLDAIRRAIFDLLKVHLKNM